MRFFLSIEERASQIPETAERLRYLRRVARSRKKSSSWYLGAFIGVASIGLSPCPPLVRPLAPLPVQGTAQAPKPDPIFLTEHSGISDHYSNGLEIRNRFQTTGSARRYVEYSSQTAEKTGYRDTITGLVFHTTESLLLPLDPQQAQSLNRTRDSLLEHVRSNKLYNFVIDRFGQVFRIVPEDQVAFHAGHSLWSESGALWVNLNESFIGIAFEARTGEQATAAQIQSGRLLTAMLRRVYRIADANCVTHAQVSINPENLKIGYHTDWAAHFPFDEVGLRSGYRTPVTAVQRFGFTYDESFLVSIGGHPWEGLIVAEKQIIENAAARGTTTARYRQLLQQQYLAIRRLNHERS